MVRWCSQDADGHTSHAYNASHNSTNINSYYASNTSRLESSYHHHTVAFNLDPESYLLEVAQKIRLRRTLAICDLFYPLVDRSEKLVPRCRGTY